MCAQECLIQHTWEILRASCPFHPFFFSLNYALTCTAEIPESHHGLAIRLVKEKSLSVYSAPEKGENQRERAILHSMRVIYTLLKWVHRFGRKGEFWGGIVQGEWNSFDGFFQGTASKKLRTLGWKWQVCDGQQLQILWKSLFEVKP